MKLFITIFLILLSFEAFADEPMLKETEYMYVEQSIGKGKPYFLEVGAESCYSCQIMGKMLYKVVEKNPQFNIHFINLKKEREVANKLKIRLIPTQIIYDAKGEEVYRHIGVLSNSEINDLLIKYQF